MLNCRIVNTQNTTYLVFDNEEQAAEAAKLLQPHTYEGFASYNGYINAIVLCHKVVRCDVI